MRIYTVPVISEITVISHINVTLLHDALAPAGAITASSSSSTNLFFTGVSPVVVNIFVCEKYSGEMDNERLQQVCTSGKAFFQVVCVADSSESASGAIVRERLKFSSGRQSISDEPQSGRSMRRGLVASSTIGADIVFFENVKIALRAIGANKMR